MPDQSSQDLTPPKIEMSRRDFLRIALVGAGIGFTAGVANEANNNFGNIRRVWRFLFGDKPATSENGEKIKPTNKAAVVDFFFPDISIGSSFKDSLPAIESLARDLGGDKFVPLEKKDWQPESFREWLNGLSKTNPELAISYGAAEHFVGHGVMVDEVRRAELEKFGLVSPSEHILLQEILAKTPRKYGFDKLGNKTISFDVRAEFLIDAFKDQKDTKIGGMSFTPGPNTITWVENELVSDDPPNFDNGIVFGGKIITFSSDEEQPNQGSLSLVGNGIYRAKTASGKEIFGFDPDDVAAKFAVTEKYEKEYAKLEPVKNPTARIESGFRKEIAAETLAQVIELGQAYKDKLFIISLGNFGEGVVEALENVDPKLLENILLVAEWTRGEQRQAGPTDDVFGAMLYVDNKKHNVSRGSSFSVPILTGFGQAQIAKLALTPEELKEVIFAQSTKETYIIFDSKTGEPEKVETLVF